MRHSLIITALFSMLLAACGEQKTAPDTPKELTVADAEVVLSPVEGRPAAAYFTLIGDEKDRALTKVDVPGAENVMLHETVESDGIASMQSVASVAVPAGETVAFARGGKHVMIFGLAKPAAGETVAMTLTFADGGTLEVKAKATTIGDAAGDSGE